MENAIPSITTNRTIKMISMFVIRAALAMVSSVEATPEPFHVVLSAPLPVSSPAPAEPSLTFEAAVAPDEAPLDSLSGFNYNYAEAVLSFGDFTGLLAEGSYEFRDGWLAVGKLGYLTKSRVDFTTVSAGVGYAFPLQARLDLVGTGELEVGTLSVDTSFGSVSRSEVGVRLRGGARYRITDEVEAFGGLGVRTIFNNNMRLDAGVLYALNDRISILGRLEFDDLTQVSLGARFGF